MWNLDGGDLLEEFVHVSVLLFIDRGRWGRRPRLDIPALRRPPWRFEALQTREWDLKRASTDFTKSDTCLHLATAFSSRQGLICVGRNAWGYLDLPQ